jgi:NADPH-dependent curcumin reductase CurA
MSRAWSLKTRPQGMPKHTDFEMIDVAQSELADGEVRIANRWLSVDPYMRGRMNDVKSYTPPFELGKPMQGGAIGEVVESRAEGLKAGDLVQHMAGWRDEATLPANQVQKLPELAVDPQAFLGQLGMLFWFARGCSCQVRRYRLRFGRGGRGGVDRRPGRQGEGHDGDRFGRRRGQMRLGQVARR